MNIIKPHAATPAWTKTGNGYNKMMGFILKECLNAHD